ncbi:hypothetical protein HALDL1_00090 (plasmid) [Halobacterium sp. DL1]|jgi:hypothetical protein|uniref:Uncharacterized protein n=2 Tax=Halorubrum lacusprofundi TaxID=2247 RepID=B9LVC3_HALLT|nr:hypothetical protein [Halorubrum lacusprofundi]ACM58636.1 conserved hypothetical protein [Halorubrum lacusprofundi ATCC 49239]AEN07738.1 hypothetical protein Halar_0494 [halophilic archaeon DL31]AHG05456.1 hypothetical protein HALDL1_00090 [Halobacterium sp. DL1]ASK38277.1 hypothetical protein [Halorubrum lacusprofundi]
MSQGSYDDTIKFRAGALKEAAGELDAIHLGGINISELARAGLADMLRRSMTDEDKITLYERYKAGEISEEATRLLLGEEFDLLQEDIEEFAAAAEDDTSQYLV